MTREFRDNGYDDWFDAVEEGEPYYLESPSGNGWLPPREIDPETGERELEEVELPDAGEIESFTRIEVATPQFADDAPFVVAVASFGPVRMTGQLRDVDEDDVEIGMPVEIGVERTETRDERVLVFRPR
jgi:hypothetical protein